MAKRLIRKSNIHDVKRLFFLFSKVYVEDDKSRRDFEKNIEALLNLIASDAKIRDPDGNTNALQRQFK